MFGSGPPPRGRGGPRGRGAPRGRGRGRGVPPPPPGKKSRSKSRSPTRNGGRNDFAFGDGPGVAKIPQNGRKGSVALNAGFEGAGDEDRMSSPWNTEAKVYSSTANPFATGPSPYLANPEAIELNVDYQSGASGAVGDRRARGGGAAVPGGNGFGGGAADDSHPEEKSWYQWDSFDWQYNLQRWSQQYGSAGFWAVVWVIAQIWLFTRTVITFTGEDFRGVWGMLGWSLLVSRAAASCLLLNGALLLLVVLRTFITKLRRLPLLYRLIPLDKNITFHKMLAKTIWFWTVVHMYAHYNNFERMADTPARWLNDALDTSYDVGQPVPGSMYIAFATVAGATGHVMVLAMLFIFNGARKPIRMGHFEHFWSTHHLGILWYILFVFHGFGYLFRIPPRAWMWVGPPMFLWLMDRLVRYKRTRKAVPILRHILHESDVLELQLPKVFKYQPGQYLLLCAPYLSRGEWHPFTITTAPEEEYIAVHIRRAGDWTGAVQDLLSGKREFVLPPGVSNARLMLLMDGPFGAPTDLIFNYRYALLVGGGIGVTPAAAILKSVFFRLRDGGKIMLETLYFVWIAKDHKAFEWFEHVLRTLEKQQVHNFLHIDIYLTEKFNAKKQAALERKNNAATRDVFTGLRSRTHFGRPNWNEVMNFLRKRHPGAEVAIFLCGATPLANEVRRCAVNHTRPGGTRFLFRKENF